MHQTMGVVLVIIQTNCHLRIQHRDIDKILAPPRNGLDAELEMWENCMSSLKNVTANKKLGALRAIFSEKIENIRAARQSVSQTERSEKSFETTLRRLKKLASFKTLFLRFYIITFYSM